MRNAAQVIRRPPVALPRSARPLIAIVFEGLSEEEKQLPSMLLYDAQGSLLFERVCEQPEYYVDRVERALLRAHGPEIAELIGPRAAIVEYGAGRGSKGMLLLDALRDPQAYVPIDVDAAQLARARREIGACLAALPVYPLCEDFRDFTALPAALSGVRRRVAFFPGSTLGQFRPLEAVALLNSMREAMGADGRLLIGVDLAKDPCVLERAYDDAAGAMAAFNMNLLARLNREVEATFEPATFQHQARWNAEQRRIEMSLVSMRRQSPTVAGIGVALGAGEQIVTEYGHKYTLDGFAQQARIAGWALRRSWIDADHLYSLHYLAATE